MPHIVIGGQIHDSGIALLDAAEGFTHDHIREVSRESVLPRLAEADGLVLRTQPLTGADIQTATKLRIVSRHGVGYDAVDVAALSARGIALAIVDDVNSRSVAEQALMLMLAAAKQARVADTSVRGGGWHWRNQLAATELWRKRLVIIGYGRIGRRLAEMAAGLGMDVVAYDPFLNDSGWPAGPARPATDLRAALAEADVVSVHAPKGDRPLIGAAELAAMKPSAIVVNTSRGGAVVEAALAAALENNRLSGAGLDVFETEPPMEDNPLLGFDNVILSPHIAGLTAECGERMAVSCVRNVLDFFAGRIAPELVVNRAAIGLPDQPFRA